MWCLKLDYNSLLSQQSDKIIEIHSHIIVWFFALKCRKKHARNSFIDSAKICYPHQFKHNPLFIEQKHFEWLSAANKSDQMWLFSNKRLFYKLNNDLNAVVCSSINLSFTVRLPQKNISISPEKPRAISNVTIILVIVMDDFILLQHKFPVT